MLIKRLPPAGGGDSQDQARIELTAREIAGQLPSLKAHVVDIGCANGGMLSALRDLGYQNLLGVDPSPECIANTQRLFGIPALQGWLGSMPKEAAKADLVILSHVLEHVLDLSNAAQCLRTLLAPRGIIYVEVPDAVRYVDCLLAPFQDFNTEHINHFSSASLANLFTSHGFERVNEGTKTLALGGGAGYPACYGFFRLCGDPQVPPIWRRDPTAIPALERYIAQSTAQIGSIDERLRAIPSGPVIVWGVGQLTLKLLIETHLGALEIAAFTDGNPMHHGKHLQGCPIFAPDKLLDLPPYPIIISSLLHHTAIAQRIRTTLNLPNPIITLS